MIEPAVVFISANVTEARLVQELLKSYKVEAFLFDENICRIDPLLTMAIGGVRVVVSEPKAKEALEILRVHKIRPGQLSPFDLAGAEPSSPQDGASQLDPQTRRRRDMIGLAILAVTILIISILFLSDAISERHFLSTKDGVLHESIQAGHPDK
ncbi:MAG: DUF2007 domain-containing protein [Elusimicrobia bacterium]|nr:DUF2007 domain-containing protein [Elusimicrobiota bacterium]